MQTACICIRHLPHSPCLVTTGTRCRRSRPPVSARPTQHALQDNIDEALIKIFYDRLCSSSGTVPCELHATIQCRLMLRVLRDNLANINQSTLDALNCLATYSAGEATTFPPLARPEDLRPSLELLLLVRGRG